MFFWNQTENFFLNFVLFSKFAFYLLNLLLLLHGFKIFLFCFFFYRKTCYTIFFVWKCINSIIFLMKQPSFDRFLLSSQAVWVQIVKLCILKSAFYGIQKKKIIYLFEKTIIMQFSRYEMVWTAHFHKMKVWFIH